MTIKTSILIGVSALALAACGGASDSSADASPNAAPSAEPHPDLAEVAAGAYSLEKNHAFLTLKVGHGGGISQYRISFTDFDADLNFDPVNPEASTLSFTVNPASVETNYPADYKAGHPDTPWQTWNEDVSRDSKWLNSDTFPEITFVSTSATTTGELAGTLTGDLTLLGVTQAVSFDVTYNGVANPPWFGERDVIGFDASTSILRSDFGMAAAIPAISDQVIVEFSGEFLQDE